MVDRERNTNSATTAKVGCIIRATHVAHGKTIKSTNHHGTKIKKNQDQAKLGGNQERWNKGLISTISAVTTIATTWKLK